MSNTNKLASYASGLGIRIEELRQAKADGVIKSMTEGLLVCLKQEIPIIRKAGNVTLVQDLGRDGRHNLYFAANDSAGQLGVHRASSILTDDMRLRFAKLSTATIDLMLVPETGKVRPVFNPDANKEWVLRDLVQSVYGVELSDEQFKRLRRTWLDRRKLAIGASADSSMPHVEGERLTAAWATLHGFALTAPGWLDADDPVRALTRICSPGWNLDRIRYWVGYVRGNVQMIPDAWDKAVKTPFERTLIRRGEKRVPSSLEYATATLTDLPATEPAYSARTI